MKVELGVRMPGTDNRVASHVVPPPLIPLVDLNASLDAVLAEMHVALERVFKSGRFVSGPEVEELEDALAGRAGVAHAVGVGSGTAALFLTLLAAGIGPGDEVVLPANTFFATAEAILATGATPVPADVDPSTGSIDPSSVDALVSERTAAVVAVHLYGLPADVDALRRLTSRRQLLLVEDAAQAFGAAWDGRPVGSLGDAAAFSFFPTKILGALGEAGAVTTDDAALARQVRLLRSHGESAKNVHTAVGFNERMDELQAAFLSVKLAYVDGEIEQRRHLAGRYCELLAGSEGVELLTVPANASPVHHLFVACSPRRDEVVADLHAAGIGAGVHYPTPIHLQPACRGLGVREGSLPNAEALGRSVLSLPLYPGMTLEQVERCATTLTELVASR